MLQVLLRAAPVWCWPPPNVGILVRRLARCQHEQLTGRAERLLEELRLSNLTSSRACRAAARAAESMNCAGGCSKLGWGDRDIALPAGDRFSAWRAWRHPLTLPHLRGCTAHRLVCSGSALTRRSERAGPAFSDRVSKRGNDACCSARRLSPLSRVGDVGLAGARPSSEGNMPGDQISSSRRSCPVTIHFQVQFS